MSVTRTSSVSSASVWSRDYGRPTIVVASVLAALVANLVLWLVGLLAGGSFEHTDAGAIVSAAPGGVVLMTVVPLAAGLTVAALLSLWWNPIVRIAQVVGALLPLATIAGTLSADFDAASTVMLVLMHVVIAAVAVLGLEKMRVRI
ncbi:hypothetical protein EV641_10469 [Rhodococcus sp. SMB37]|uniref:DUF6069 family protein n=1 Tax=Rhodococcus sp. SMB37 TaxID=2512213 RepID=UPI0006CF3B2D|nr:DUF6069 family protein [Rhodococcus sp. SMB37]TCN54806.1 hypothetical protein EV641_10469 [Rhodococcus sp. SMB37]